MYRILTETTQVFRKGTEVVHEPSGAVSIYGYPHVSDAAGLELVDCHFVVVGVDKAKAEEHAGGFAEVLAGYPALDRLAGGPSYIEVGGEIGDQAAAFRLFALGQVLGMWTVITPATLGLSGPEADEFAGRGFVMMSGWSPAAPRPLAEASDG